MREVEKHIYLEKMEGVRARIDFIKNVLASENINSHEKPFFETIALQQRKILESVSFSLLAVYKEEYQTRWENLERIWRTNRIFKKLDEINADWFPKPVTMSSTGPNAYHIDFIKEGVLTKEGMLSCVDDLGDWLHERNPFSQDQREISDADFEKLNEYVNKTTKLLNHHLIRKRDGKGFYLIQMVSNTDGKTHMYDIDPQMNAD